MKNLKLSLAIVAFLVSVSLTETTIALSQVSTDTIAIKDPLPSWTDGSLKKDIVAYVKNVTDKNSKDFIPLEDRIATFDNDGTLWVEKPYIQVLFMFFQMDKMLKANPEIAAKEPFKSYKEKGPAFIKDVSEKELIELLVLTHTGTTEKEFEANVKEFEATAKLPKRNVPIRQGRYQPQLELLDYLKSNGFTIFICTGGTAEFVRAFSKNYYGIPKSQVIGTRFKYGYDEEGNTILRKSEIDHFNDKAGKPVGIQQSIGQKPVFACGNEGGSGDIEMLKFCQGSKYKSFQLLVNHDDEAREYLYEEKDNASLNAAAKHNWHVISMKNDWKTIFAK